MLFDTFVCLTKPWLLLPTRQRFTVKPQFLLITQEIHTRWPATLQTVLADIGTLEIMCENTASQATLQNYAIIMIDAGTISDEVALVTRLITTCPQACVIVATASPTWTRARDALKAGATDYILKSIKGNELRAKFQKIMEMLQLR
ncbi:hypothetical protein BH10CHL1_BH10CHL1_48070 [soil metagenome]